MRLTGIDTRYLLAKTDVDKNYFDGANTYKAHAAALSVDRQPELSVTRGGSER